MKRLSIALILTLAILFGCNVEETTEVLNEEESIVKDIRFVDDFWGKGIAVHVDTAEETLVLSKRGVEFVKSTNEETTINIRKIHDSKNKLFPESTEATIYVAKSDTPTLSRKYADEFGDTLIIANE